jgi:hypothetical protein
MDNLVAQVRDDIRLWGIRRKDALAELRQGLAERAVYLRDMHEMADQARDLIVCAREKLSR